MPERVKHAVLKAAVDAVGERALALYLNVPDAHVRRWLGCEAPIPDQTFLHLVDVLAATLKEHPPKAGK